MKLFFLWIYGVNAVLLFLYLTESAACSIWESWKLPGKRTGFLMLLIPVYGCVLWGFKEILLSQQMSMLFTLLLGMMGIVLFILQFFSAKTDPDRLKNKFSKGLLILLLLCSLTTISLGSIGLLLRIY